MNTVKELHQMVKLSPTEENIITYNEHIDMLVDKHPYNYITQLEYIIKSAKGLQSAANYINNKNVSVVSYKFIENAWNDIRDTYVEKGYDSSIYECIDNAIDNYYSKNALHIAMYESMGPIGTKYTKSYYNDDIISSGTTNSLINKYGMAIMPDILKDKNVNSVLKEYVNNPVYFKPENSQWVYDIVESMNVDSTLLNMLYENTYMYECEKFNDFANDCIMESAIMCDESIIEYDNGIIESMERLLSIRESQQIVINSDDLNEIIEKMAESIDIMCTNHYNEDLSLSNARHKKRGDVPTYLSDNHDLEDKQRNNEDSETDIYRRASVPDDMATPISEPEPDYSPEPEPEPDPVEPEVVKAQQATGNTYYYYTYNHSNNKTHRTDNSTNNDLSKRSNNSVNTNNSQNTNSYNTAIDRDINESNDAKFDFDLDIDLSFEPDTFMEDDAPKNYGDVDLSRPESDNKMRDLATDIDQRTTKHHQAMKKKVDDIGSVGSAFTKPVRRTAEWIGDSFARVKDRRETRQKENLADPHARKTLFNKFKTLVAVGSIAKAGLLLNPLFIFIAGFGAAGNSRRKRRIKNEMIGELKTEITILEKKIEDARANAYGNPEEAYRLERLKNELTKKLVRVGGNKAMRKSI